MTTAEGPVVHTTAGALRGRDEVGLTVFRGIPFAAPPVGEHRFQAPQPVRAWDGVRQAYDFGPPPPQDMAFQGRRGELDAPGGDEWLTVNVWTPEAGASIRRPVMVWIYGGAYKAGHAGSPGYDAQHLARAGEVVVVTFNHRLGIEGFARIEGAPANRGLLDQVAALEWVRDNIAAFGGDPAQVTIFGESAGAGGVASLLAMPSARGLFHRAVVQSLPGTFFSDELARDVAAEIAREAGLAPTAAALSTVDPRQLTAAGETLGGKMREYADRWGQLAPTPTPFSPVVDGEVLPTTPWQALADGAGRDVDLLVGHNRDEYRLFLVMGGQLGKITEEQAAWALRTFGPGPDGERAYRSAFPEAAPGELYERVQTDWLFNMPSLQLAEAQVAGGGRAHVYELTWSAPGAGGTLGACHGLDVPLLFGTYEADLGNLLFMGSGVPDEARKLSARFRSSWTAFARTGEPGWPVYDLNERLVQVLDVEPEVRPSPEEISRRLWEAYEFPALRLHE
ncbi:carboxylesterase/lipase family protein [Streptomyces sp. NPDC101455]|uniref:carboxylesterase/lipase family protein n=1 Tax=Streptomyces sp. NPDC101455 TaxID=3366142 RepID=UPI003820A579